MSLPPLIKMTAFRDVPVEFHWALLLLFPFFWALDGFLHGSISIIPFVALMVAHEFGHAFFVRKYRHELSKITIFPFHGTCEFHYDARYEPEPLIYAGGLLAQAVVLVLSAALLGLFSVLLPEGAQPYLVSVWHILVPFNLFMMALNALPIPGLDGYELWKIVYENVLHNWRDRRAAKGSRKQRRDRKNPERVVDFALDRAKQQTKSKTKR